MTTIRELRDRVGEEVAVSPWLDVGQERIDTFAKAIEDFQWIHVDPARAKSSRFGGTIAHGFLTLSLLPAMRSKAAWKVVGYGNATNYGANKLRFVSPVPAGSKVHSHGRLIGVDTHPKGTQITQEVAVHVVGSDKPALLYEMVVLYHPPVKRG